ncbi:MAG: hypothetical protein WDN06_03010 [Asticcacaulis sp.]
MLAVAAAIALWVIHVADRSASVPAPGPSTYIQLDHEGSQTKTPPLVRIGTADSLPPQPLFMINHLPAPLNLSFTENVAVDPAQFQGALAVTAGLKCQDTVPDSWTELTVSVFAGGKRASYCLLDGQAAHAYVHALSAAMPESLRNRGSTLDSLANFFDFAAYGSTTEPAVAPEARWTELKHDGAGQAPYPAILFGTDAGLDEAARQHAGDGDVRLKLTVSQYEMMALGRHDAMCAADPPGTVFDDDFHIRSGEKGAYACKTYGEYGCYYLNRLYSLSLPGSTVAGIENVRTLADRLGCRPEGWGVYSYVDLHRGGPYRDQAAAPVVWLGTEAGLPPSRPDVSRIVISEAQYRQLLDLLRQRHCNFNSAAPAFATVTPYQDGLKQVDCLLDADPARAYAGDLIRLIGPAGQGAGLDDLHRIAGTPTTAQSGASR